MHILISLTLVLSPFLLGLNRPLAWTALAVTLLAVATLQPRVFAPPSRWARRHTVVAGLVLAALFALALPLIQLASGSCAAVPSVMPCVTDPESSWLSLACALMLALWFLLLTGPARPPVNTVLMALAMAGSLHALYALLAFFLGFTPLLLDGVQRHDNVPTGGFPNRNHLAAFLYVCIFATIALVLRLPADTGTGRAGRWRMLLDQRLAWRLAIMLMVLALIATRSRAGNAVFIIGLLAGFAWLMLVERRRSLAARKPLRWKFVAVVIASVLVLDALLMGSLVGLDKVRQRISDTSLEGEQRGDVTQALLANPELFTAAGHGAASFPIAFEPVKPAGLPLIYDQAHNDYLQVLVERGWIGGLLFAGAMIMMLTAVLARTGNHRGAEVRFALVASTAALLLHAGVEFVTQIPVIWLAWIALLAVAVHPGHRPRANASRGRARTASASPRSGTSRRAPAPAHRDHAARALPASAPAVASSDAHAGPRA